VAEDTPSTGRLTERDLRQWGLIEQFQERLCLAAQKPLLSETWAHRQRLLDYSDYLSLFLFGLLNPVVRTMRALCAASRLDRVQKEVCSRPVSLGSFSEAQGVLDVALLQEVFGSLSQQLSAGLGAGKASERLWLIQDGSLFEALPRMHWCLWRRQGKAQCQVRLHLSLDLAANRPVRALVTPGKECERAALRKLLQPGDCYVGDRYYGEDYQMFGQMTAGGVVFVTRLREEAVMTIEEELPLTDADRKANVTRQAWVKLGSKGYRLDQRLRVVWVQTPKEVLRLVTNLSVEEFSGADVALLYKERWRIEMFFRWVKCILGCRHWLAESPEGVAIQVYLALIAALLLQLYTGQRPSRRIMEMIQFYLLGVASLEELWAAVERERTQKKS
jgi:DDE family transposase